MKQTAPKMNVVFLGVFASHGGGILVNEREANCGYGDSSDRCKVRRQTPCVVTWFGGRRRDMHRRAAQRSRCRGTHTHLFHAVLVGEAAVAVVVVMVFVRDAGISGISETKKRHEELSGANGTTMHRPDAILTPSCEVCPCLVSLRVPNRDISRASRCCDGGSAYSCSERVGWSACMATVKNTAQFLKMAYKYSSCWSPNMMPNRLKREMAPPLSANAQG